MTNKTSSIVINLLFIIGILFFSMACQQTSSKIKKLSDADLKACAEQIVSNYQDPVDYVISKFKEHDIVFIGEKHIVKQYLEFLHELIPHLHKNGIYNLSYEFGLYVDQDKIDRLITADVYNEALANEVTLNAKGREYADVYRAAWEVNQKLPKGARKFRVIGSKMRSKVIPESENSGGKTHREKNRARNMILGGHFYDVQNKYWADVIAKECIMKGEKALVYGGSGHTSTKFRFDRSPRLVHFISAGNFIYNFIDDKAIQILLHGALVGRSNNEAKDLAVIEEIMQRVPAESRRVGFDTSEGTPLGEIPTPGVTGYLKGRTADFTLSDLCEGYIFLAPRAEFKPTNPLK